MMEHSDYYIYCYFHPETGEPCYIGKGRGGRWKAHLTSSKNPWLANIIQKANGNIPHVKLHIGLTNEKANEYEKALIEAIGRDPRGPLVNMTDGGEGTKGWVPSDDTKNKIGELTRQRLADPEFRRQWVTTNIGRKASSETRAKQSLARRGRKLTPETVEKIASANRGRKRSPEIVEKCRLANLGRKHSNEVREKMAAAQRGRKHSPETRQKISQANQDKRLSEHTKQKIAIAHIGKTLSEFHKQKISIAGRGRSVSTETREKLRVSNINRQLSPEVLERIRIGREKGVENARLALKGSKWSPQRVTNAHGKKLSAEHRNAIGNGNRGRKVSAETRIKLATINRGRKASQETRAKMAEAQRRRFERESANGTWALSALAKLTSTASVDGGP